MGGDEGLGFWAEVEIGEENVAFVAEERGGEGEIDALICQ